jgi:hypothetical protein
VGDQRHPLVERVGDVKVYDGKIQAIEAFMKGMPLNTPSGWDAK